MATGLSLARTGRHVVGVHEGHRTWVGRDLPVVVAARRRRRVSRGCPSCADGCHPSPPCPRRRYVAAAFRTVPDTVHDGSTPCSTSRRPVSNGRQEVAARACCLVPCRRNGGHHVGMGSCGLGRTSSLFHWKVLSAYATGASTAMSVTSDPRHRTTSSPEVPTAGTRQDHEPTHLMHRGPKGRLLTES
ncbi:protein of unknown function [Blastococcus saxobsidens DD2]|uniref:Uncharacterized protein n=1 Tax=Blastococcus saxobsidens (strain DD2) TaxID=1146883 RepID=H6RNT3_BLASD|nr:protein of unknown function [Blastococcus saxobsidens DD2]